ncbi:MAG: hypothetical protein U0359_01245 [Byssovorax sp.]
MTKTILVMMVGMMATGCSCDPPAEERPKGETARTEGSAAQAPAPQPTPAQAPGAGPSIGIEACDEYFRQAQICFAHNVMMKAQLEGSLDDLRGRLIEQAKDPANHARLADRCVAHTKTLIEDCSK